MSNVVFDAGAFIAFERNSRDVLLITKRILALGGRIIAPAGVVGQVWRDGRKQARLARLLAAPLVVVEPLDDRRARAAGQLCGVAGTRDVIDAVVVLAARAHDCPVATSDAGDLSRLDPKLSLIEV